MLVLTRRRGEAIQVGEAVVTVLKIAGSQVKLGITGPRDVQVNRTEARRRRDATEGTQNTKG